MGVVINNNGKFFLHMKGAPELMMKFFNSVPENLESELAK